MTREIKFRVWDKENKRFIKYNPHISLDVNGNVYNLQNGEGNDIYELSQYIGLKDKNGKEIYEGDIVNGGCYNGSYAYGKVEFREYQFMAIPIGKFLEGFDDNFKTMEIIGNIYENTQI